MAIVVNQVLTIASQSVRSVLWVARSQWHWKWAGNNQAYTTAAEATKWSGPVCNTKWPRQKIQWSWRSRSECINISWRHQVSCLSAVQQAWVMVCTWGREISGHILLFPLLNFLKSTWYQFCCSSHTQDRFKNFTYTTVRTSVYCDRALIYIYQGGVLNSLAQVLLKSSNHASGNTIMAVRC